MDPVQYMQALAELWGQGGKSFVAAQQTLLRDMAERYAKAASAPGAPAGPQANFFDPQGVAQANDAFGRLWSSALELSQTFARNLQQGKEPDPLVSSLLGRIFDPSAWFAGSDGMDAALHRLAHGPRLADVWNTERQMLNVFNAWTALRRRGLEHNTLMLEAWLQAAGAFARLLNEKADRNEAIGSWRDVLALWVETANAVLLETQRSEAYLKSQRELLKASTDLRLAQQEVAEFYSQMFGYPTRAEIDDVHKALTELRREVRALERATRDRPAAAAPARRPRVPGKPAASSEGIP
jgi:class III poly(R)-hydroxyalkanoic acid synthase PhaE subunit